MTTPGSPIRKLVFDEQLDKRLLKPFEDAGYQCVHLRDLKLAGTKDHLLIPTLRAEFDFDAMVVHDKSIPFQNNFKPEPGKKDLSLVVIRTWNRNKGTIEDHKDKVLTALQTLKANQPEVVFVGVDELVRRDQAAYLLHQLRHSPGNPVPEDYDHERKSKPVEANHHQATYRGRIIGSIDGEACQIKGETYQDIAERQFIYHETKTLPKGLEPGRFYNIEYKNGRVASCKMVVEANNQGIYNGRILSSFNGDACQEISNGQFVVHPLPEKDFPNGLKAGRFYNIEYENGKPSCTMAVEPNNEGIYNGRILGSINGDTCQKISQNLFIVHQTDKLPGVEPGRFYNIKYSQGEVVSCKINKQLELREQQRSKGKER